VDGFGEAHSRSHLVWFVQPAYFSGKLKKAQTNTHVLDQID
jgi:hypothetical protein